jgi:hypothetical protein
VTALPFPIESAPAAVTARQVRDALARYRFPISVEKALQDAVESALLGERLGFMREVTRGADRIDFLVGSVGVELKVKGSVSEVTRQLERYALWGDVSELLLVTTRGHHLAMPRELNGKPVLVHMVRGVLF